MAKADEMLDEAIRIGAQATTQASRYMSLSLELVKAIDGATKHLECGMTKQAHDILVEARIMAGRHTLEPGTNLIEMVMRSIAIVREQNGAAPFDAWDAIHGRHTADIARQQLREEAIAVLDALGIKKE